MSWKCIKKTSISAKFILMAAAPVIFTGYALAASGNGISTPRGSPAENITGMEMKNGTILTADDDGKNIKAAVGDVLRVDLRLQGGTGYNWYPDEINEKLLKLKGTRTRVISERNSAGAPAAGGPVLGMWYFQTIAPGDTDIRMLYYRIWEGKESARKSITVHVHIVQKK